MAFKIVKNLIVKWRVDVEAPADNNKTQKSDFIAEFKILSNKEFVECSNKAKDDIEFIKSFLVGWDDLLDENDKPLKFTTTNINRVLSYAFVRNAIFKAYNAASTGIGDPEIKN